MLTLPNDNESSSHPFTNLSNRCCDASASRGPHHKDNIPVLVKDHGGAHGGEGPLPRFGKVGLGGFHLVQVGDVLVCKVTHVVVEQDPSGGGEEHTAKTVR